MSPIYRAEDECSCCLSGVDYIEFQCDIINSSYRVAYDPCGTLIQYRVYRVSNPTRSLSEVIFEGKNFIPPYYKLKKKYKRLRFVFE